MVEVGANPDDVERSAAAAIIIFERSLFVIIVSALAYFTFALRKK